MTVVCVGSPRDPDLLWFDVQYVGRYFERPLDFGLRHFFTEVFEVESVEEVNGNVHLIRAVYRGLCRIGGLSKPRRAPRLPE